MDLAPRNGEGVSLLAFDRDHINQLLTNLAEVDTLVGQPVPKTRMGWRSRRHRGRAGAAGRGGAHAA